MVTNRVDTEIIEQNVDAIPSNPSLARAPTMSASATVQFELISDPNSLDKYEDDWNRLEQQSPDSACFDDYRQSISDADSVRQMRLFVIKDAEQIIGFAPFLLFSGKKKYTLGERQLFGCRVQYLALFGRDCVGSVPVQVAGNLLDAVLCHGGFTLLELRDIATDGALYQALTGSLQQKCVWRNRGRKTALHWLIELPESMDKYLSSMKSKTRQTLKRKQRKFLEEQNGSVVCVSNAGQLRWFLDEGEKISRKTYQWSVGQRLQNDPVLFRSYKQLADAGRLRCYMLMDNEKPCAFMRGFLVRDTYVYETPGFDPAYGHLSPGTVLMMHSIADLIENTQCRIFDFGEGGDDVGYKSIFGNRSFPTVTLDVSGRSRFYPRILFSIQDTLDILKNTGHWVLADARIKTTIRKWLRKGGAATKQETGGITSPPQNDSPT